MATADTLSSSTLSSSSPSHSQHIEHHDHDDDQDPASPVMVLRFPTHRYEATLHDAKTSGHCRPRRWLAQVFTNAYNDILRTWMGLHRSFHHPAAAHPHAHPGQYHTFTCSDATSSCGSDASCTTTDAGAFSAAVGEMILEPPINILLVCVPLGIAAYHAAAPPLPSVLVFAVNVLAIAPLSSLLTDATERIALEAGDTVGAFLNISLGNIVELILFVVTLINGHVKVVQASILGSILVNLLPILGSALVVADATGGDDSLDGTETQMLACLLCVSVFVFMIPTAFRFTFSQAPNINDIVVHMSRVSAVLILFMYTAYFLHTMQQSTHRDADEEGGESLRLPVTPPPLLRRRTSSPPPLTPGPRTLRFADGAKTQPTSDLYARRVFEVGPPASVDSADGPPPPPPPPDEELQPPRGRSLTGTRGPHSAHTVLSPLLLSRLSRSRSTNSRASSWMSQRPLPRSFARAGLARVLSTDRRRRAFREPAEDEASGTTDGRLGAALAAVVVLLVASLLLAVSARLLAGTLDAVTRRRPLSQALIGVVLLPLAGNLSSCLTVAAVAARDNLDLAVAVSAGSAIQVALCVAPLTVLAGWVLGRPVVLALDGFEMAMLLGAASLVNLLVLGGNGGGDKRRATGLKGGILCACFLVMGIATFFAPNGK